MTFRKPSHSLRTKFGRKTELGSAGDLSPSGSARTGLGRRRAKRRDEKRRSLLENLENRQLLAGPELIGIQPNEGDLLFNGDTLNFSPKELVFRFDDNTRIDESTLDAIRITRAGEDGVFESASVMSDLGSGGQALFEFRAIQTGSLGNGIEIRFTSSNRGGTSLPLISQDESIRTLFIDLNRNPSLPTRARDLVSGLNAFNNSLTAAGRVTLVEAIQVSGPSLQVIGSQAADGKVLTLDGANAAKAVTDFGSNGRYVSG